MNEFVQTWFPVTAFFLSAASLALGFYINYVAQKRVTAAAKDIYERMNRDAKSVASLMGEHGDRLTKLESTLSNTPGHDEFHELARQLSAMAGDIKALTAELHGVRDTQKTTQMAVQRIDNYLLNGKVG